MKYITLTGIATSSTQVVPINLPHDFGRPVNLQSIRIVSFSYPFDVANTFIGQRLFTLNGTTLDDEHRLRSSITVNGQTTKYTWGALCTLLSGQKGVFQHDFSTVEQNTWVTPAQPAFTNQLVLSVDDRTHETGTANMWPAKDSGWEFSVTLEIVEA